MTGPVRPLEDLVADALAAHDEGGETALSAYLDGLGPRASEVRSVVDRFFAVGLLTRPGPAPAFPERLGDFRLLQQLGAGGMGVVFRAEQTSLRREVALKVVRPELLLFEGARERFRREVDAIAQLRHPGIVPILAVGEDRGIPYFAMDLVAGRSGEDLTAALRGRAPASLSGHDLWTQLLPATAGDTMPSVFSGAWWQVCARLCAQVAHAMRHAHLRGILHRDLKPSNVMLTPHGHALVLDFGLARVAADERITRTGSELGSPAYMSPEQVRGEPLDDRTDVYSLGATLYQLLCLTPPFRGSDGHALRARILAGAPPSPRADNSAVPRDLATVCLKALDPDRARRYASMVEFALDLEAAAEHRPVLARPLGLPRRVVRWAGRHRTTAVATGLAVVFLALTPLLLWVQQRAANRRLDAEFQRAQRSLAVSKDAIQAMLVRVGKVQLGSVPGAETLRTELLQEAVNLYERLRADESTDPSLRGDRMRTLEQLGKMFVELGRYDDAEKALTDALLVADSAATSGGEDMPARTRLLQAIAAVQMARGQFQTAAETLRQKQRELDELQARAPTDRALRFGRATTLSALAECEQQARGDDPGLAAERERLLRAASTILADLVAEQPDDANVIRTWAASLQRLSYALQDQRRFAEALALLDREIAIVEPLPDDKDARPRRDELLMLAWSAKGTAHFEAGDYAAAVTTHQRSVDYAEALARDFPTAAGYTCRLGAMISNGAAALLKLDRPAEAEPQLRRAIEQHRAALAMSPDLAEAKRFLRACHHMLADCLAALARGDEAVAIGAQLAESRGEARDAIDAAAILAQLLTRDPRLVLTDRDAVRQRTLDLLLEAERRGWPAGLKLNAKRYRALEGLAGFAELRARRE